VNFRWAAIALTAFFIRTALFPLMLPPLKIAIKQTVSLLIVEPVLAFVSLYDYTLAITSI
jgi:hypothetical protein